jgi:Xaa-Pro aminopeptidase
MDYGARTRRLAEALKGKHLDALLVTHMANVRYLCGFTGSSGVLMARAAGSVLVTDGRYTQQAREEVQSAKVIIAKGPVLAEAAKHVTRHITLGIEAEHMTVATRSALGRLVPGGVRLKNTSAIVQALRMIKDREELNRLRAAVLLGSSIFDKTLGAIRPGVSEITIAGALEYAARRAGATGMSFDTIVASGVRSALPHGCASASRVPRHGFVLLDFGVILTGYCSDMTRTVHVGKPDQAARRLYDAVREAQQSALEAVRPGVAAGEIDRVARRGLQRAGFGRYFTHSTGHGVGLEIHEPPRLGKGQAEVLRPGMVITIEPGAYIPGQGGVRIEDMVAVTERGCEVLTPTSKELITV